MPTKKVLEEQVNTLREYNRSQEEAFRHARGIILKHDDLAGEVQRLLKALRQIASVPEFREDDPLYTVEVARAALRGLDV